jgi:hypothetical protein
VLHGADHGADLSDVDVGGGSTIHAAESAKYLGSIVHRSGSDRPDVISRINSAKGAFAVLKKCMFTRKDVSYEGKRKVYEGLLLQLTLPQTPALRAVEQDGEDQALVHLALSFVGHVLT